MSIVAIEFDKATGGEQAAGFAAGVEAEACHSRGVSDCVRLADKRERSATTTQVFAERHFANGERHPIPCGAVTGHVTAGVKRHARGSAHARLHEGTLEAHPAGCQRIQIARGKMRMTVAAQVIGTQLITHDEEQIAYRAHP